MARSINIFLILVGCAIMGISYNMFNAETGIVLGGMTGFSMVIEKLILKWFNFDIPFIYIFIVINIFLFSFGFKVMGKKFFIYSLIGTAGYIISLQTTVFARNLGVPTSDLLLCAIFGGVLIGCGAGLIFRCGGSTGGTDIIGCVVNHKHSHINIGTVVWLINGFIIILTIFLDNMSMGLYGLIYIYLNGLMINTIMQGYKGISVFYITTRKGDILSKEILLAMGQKVTITHVQSLEFPNEDLQVLSCVVHYYNAHQLKALVYNVDEGAFIYSCKVNEAFNEGFEALDDGANIFTKMQRYGKLSSKLKCQHEILALREDEKNNTEQENKKHSAENTDINNSENIEQSKEKATKTSDKKTTKKSNNKLKKE